MKVSFKTVAATTLTILLSVLVSIAIWLKTRSGPDSFHTQMQIVKSQFRELQASFNLSPLRNNMMVSKEEQELLQRINLRVVKRQAERNPSIVNLKSQYPDLKQRMADVHSSVHVQAMVDFEDSLKEGKLSRGQIPTHAVRIVNVLDFEVVLVGSGRSSTAVLDYVLAELANKRNWRIFVFESCRPCLEESIRARFKRGFGIHAVPGLDAGHEWSGINQSEKVPEYPAIPSISTVGFRRPFLLVIHSLDIPHLSVRHMIESMNQFATSMFQPHIVLISRDSYLPSSSQALSIENKSNNKETQPLSDEMYISQVMSLGKYIKLTPSNEWISGYDIFYSREYFLFCKSRGLILKKNKSKSASKKPS